MTLVVAGIHDEDRITMVADTKITWVGDVTKTRRTYENALAKIVLLRDDVAVGIAGDNPHERIRLLVGMRDAPVEDLLDVLWREERAAFIVTTLNPAQLWIVEDGEVRQCLRYSQGWIGDDDAHNLFQKRYTEWPDGTDVPSRLISSMQWLTSLDPVGSAGGYTIQATGTPAEGFLFPPDYMVRFPDRMRVTHGQIHDDKATFTLEVPPGVDPTISELFVLAGRGATPGAIGLLHPLAKAGRLFRHEVPNESVTVVASTPDEFVRVALEEYGQEVVHGGRPPGLEFLS